MKIILIGANGRMGKNFQNFCIKQNVKVIPIDINNRQELLGLTADIVVDFSSSEALKENIQFAYNKQIPIVIATTNHTKENIKLMQKYKNKIPIFYSPNMSIQFNIMSQIIEKLKIINACDFVITEVHHKHKKDKPSGSAKLLIKKLNQINIKPCVNVIRVAEVIGEHKLQVFDNMEQLEIKHIVLDRTVFCKGTFRACEFILNKQNGFYNMESLIDNL